MNSVYFLTLGCPKNEADSALMRDIVRHSRFVIVNDIKQANIVVINTCGFITEATEESIDTILEVAREWKDNSPKRHIVVTGCLVSRYSNELEEQFEEVSAFLTVIDEVSIVACLENLVPSALSDVPGLYESDRDVSVNSLANVADSSSLSAVHTSLRHTAEGASAYVKIADGCNKRCAFCTIPSIRGPYVSRNSLEIIDEINALVESGAAEIVLIAQDTSFYGKDLEGGYRLKDLVSDICTTTSVRWLRIMYLQPEGVTDELLQTMAQFEQVCPYIEMPLQHCNKLVLSDMNRRGSEEGFSRLLERIRSIFPLVAIRSTFIAGYPTESEEQHEELLDFIASQEFDFGGVFPYSVEDSTDAALLETKRAFSQDVRIDRAQQLRDALEISSFTRAASWIGHTVDVLIEGSDGEGNLYGRTRFQAPDIDGIVRITCDDSFEIGVGHIVSVTINENILADLEGTIVGN